MKHSVKEKWRTEEHAFFSSFLQVTSGTLIHITLISSRVENASLSILPKETTLASASKIKKLTSYSR